MKKMLWGLAASALVLSSCSTNEVDDVVSGNDNPNAINFMPSTTKAIINDLDIIKMQAQGFKVYAANAANASAWVINGKNYKFNSGNWGWLDAPIAWPAAGAGAYPLSFYAMYPAGYTNAVVDQSVIDGKPTLKATITVPVSEEANGFVINLNQCDLLAAKATATAKPTNGYLSLTFNHIMSKINAGIIPGYNTNVYVQAVKFNGSNTVNTFDYVTGTWSAAAKTPKTMVYVNKANTGYTGDANLKVLTFSNTTDQDETVSQPCYTPGHNNNLMLMPQTQKPQSFAKPVNLEASNTYIEVIYRVTDKNGKDLVGVTAASTTSIPNWDGNPTNVTNRPLFVKVGFAVSNEWVKGNGYMYKIMLGTVAGTGGNYLDDKYYDENGKQTTIQITDGGGKPVEPGDPVNKGTIDFIVDVAPWGNDTNVPVQ